MFRPAEANSDRGTAVVAPEQAPPLSQTAVEAASTSLRKAWWRGGSSWLAPGAPTPGRMPDHASPHDDEAVAARSDEELVVAVARGDRSAFQRFYDRTAGLVYGNVRRVVRDQVLSDEVTYQVFLDVWTQAADFDPTQEPARIWLLDLAHRRMMSRADCELTTASPQPVQAGTRESS